MSRYYYIGSWILQSDAELGDYWRSPDHTVGLVDLRGTSGGVGFFALDQVMADATGYAYFGDSLNATMTPQQVADWAAQTGVSVPAGTYTLLDLLWYTLTDWASPEWDTHAPPIMPTHAGLLELHLGGHSLVRSRAFKGADDPAWPHIQERVQRDMRSAWDQGQADSESLRTAGVGRGIYQRIVAYRAANGGTVAQARTALRAEVVSHPRKVLGALVRKYGVDWQELVPTDLRAVMGGPETPTTTYADDFNRASLGADWTAVDGVFTIASNEFRGPTIAASGFPGSARYEHDLSSADHYAQVDFVWAEATGAIACGAVRFSAAAETFYYGFIRASGSLRNLAKCVTGTATNLASDASGFGPPHSAVRVTADGSTISFSVNGVTVHSITDTSITGNLRTGIVTHNAITSESTCDNFSAADLLAATGNPWYYYAQIGA